MSFQKQNKILVVAPAAYDPLPESASALIESCYHYGIELQLIGQGQPFPNLRHKIKLVSDYLMEHPEYEYVLQLDLRDIVVCATLQEMFSKYLAFGHEIVASAERSCWPIPAHAYQSPDVGTSCRYLNSGSIFATRSAWLNAWQRMEEKINVWQGLASEVSAEEHELLKRDDQGAWSDLYINKEADIVIDARSELFQVLLYTDYRIARENPDYQFEGRRILNRETGTRPCLYHANGNVPIRPWWNYVLHPKPTWIWPLIERIRTAPREQLRDVAAVHDLLLELGLHETGGDNPSSWLSDQYLPYSGKGLQIWQRPDEFAEYLVWLSKRNTIRSYLEIGVNLGGSFIATTEYLKRFHQLDLAIGVDPWLSAPVKNYVRYTNGVDFIRGTRDSDRLRRLAEQTMFDLCMIDGDHAASAVRADWEFAQQHGRYVAFHDIAAPFMPGVQNLWQEIRSSHQSTHQFITRHREAKPAMGIGIVDLS